MIPVIYRVPATLKARGVGRTQHYADIGAGLFTKPVKLGRRMSGWPDTEVEALNRARIAGKSDVEIKALVRRLEVARVALCDGGAAK